MLKGKQGRFRGKNLLGKRVGLTPAVRVIVAGPTLETAASAACRS